ncbi:MAG TPA: amidohydrolase family protein [Gemmatimonadaceae bacterium]|nr:amidohydrolase family protein [Gemmatimonadaceae bacterium]
MNRAIRGLIPIVLAAAPAHAVQAQNGTWALTNARIETVTRGTIDKGTIVIRNGLIEAVGATVTLPPDARVIDLTGRVVTPGFFDLTSSLGLPAPATGGGGGGGGGGPPGQQQQPPSGPVGMEPGREVASELRISENDVRTARNAGITSVVVAPTRGPFRGLSALVPMRDDTASRWIVRSPVALHMGFQTVPGRYPGSLLGVIAYERQQFYDAQRHGLVADRYRANPRGSERPRHDPHLDALVPVVRGNVPVFFAAENENEIRRALNIGREFNLKLSVVGATEAFRAMDALKGARVPVISVDFPEPAATTGWNYRGSQRLEPNDSTTRAAAARKVLEGNPATLHSAGVRFALTSGTLRPDAFVTNVRKAIAGGLPRSAALEALTIRAAEAAGVESQLGSIEPGKIANLVVTQGEPLTDSARVRTVFVDGIRYEVVATPARPATRGGGGGGGGDAQVAGAWNVSTQSPQGTVQGTMTITQSGDSFEGTMTTEFGTVPIREGTITGRTISWTITVNAGPQPIIVNYEGQVEGERITGRATVGEFGSFPFTGQRRPQ